MSFLAEIESDCLERIKAFSLRKFSKGQSPAMSPYAIFNPSNAKVTFTKSTRMQRSLKIV